MKTITIIVLLIISHGSWADSLVKLGPYNSQQEFNETTDFLTTNQIRFQTNDDAVIESLGFIVVTDPMDLSAADELVKSLRTGGVKDLLYIRNGVYINRISAGIYSSSEGADIRSATLSKSGINFGVIERQRTISSVSITIVTSDIEPSIVDRFETFTGRLVPLEAGVTAEPTPPPEPDPSSNKTPETITINPPSEVENRQGVSSNPTPGKIVVQRKPVKQTGFPLVPFLSIASTMLIVLGSFYFFTRRKTVIAKEVPGLSAPFEEVIEPPTLKAEHETPPLPERHLDGSVGAISAYANQILSGQSPGKDEVPQYLATIEMGGTEVLDLISDIINLSRIEIGQVPIERISFDPESALQDLVKSLLPKADAKGISLYFEAHEDLPDLVASDPGKLEKILLPLVHHAIECTSSGKVSVTAIYDETTELLEIAIEHATDTLTAAQIETLFESSSSMDNIHNEKTLRFAVSKRFASLLGGNLQISHNSTQDIKYLVTIQADEILKKQLLLPSGLSIDELLESESSAVQFAENAKTELDSAQKEAGLAATALTKAEEQARALSEKLETAQSLANDEKVARSELENRSSEAINELNLDLETTKIKLQTELDAFSEAESKAINQVTELEAALSHASEELQNQSIARQAAEESARGQVEQLSRQLKDAKAQQDASTKKLKINSTSKKELEEIQTAFEDAKTNLAGELEARSKAADEYDSQINVLQSQLAASKVVSIQETNNRVELEESIQSLTQDWDEARQTLQAQLKKSEQLAGDNRLQAEHLSTALKKARHEAESQGNKYLQLEQESSEKLEVLELELGIANQQAIDDAKQAEESISTAGEELNLLRQQLLLAEATLQEDLAENNNQHGAELSTLQSALSVAQQNLDHATSTKVRVEESSGSQIEALINDVNQARTAARKEAETRVAIEKETQGQIDYMASELKDARKSQEAEARARTELDQVSEFARETSQRLDNAEARVIQMEAEKETAEQQLLTTRIALQEMREEAGRLAKSEEASRKMVQQRSEVDPSISSMEIAPVRSSLSTNHPVLHSLVERFIERLTHQLGVMDSSIQRGKYLDLLVSVNWLKGDSNSLGFSKFEPVISELELNLRQQSFEAIPGLVNQLKDIASRIELPEAEADSSHGGKVRKKIEPIQLVLPDNGKKAELQENFISQLGSKLMEMEAAWQEGNISRLQKDCRWIQRYGLKMKLEGITGPTEKLQTALKEEDHARISQHLQNFLDLYTKIVIVRH